MTIPTLAPYVAAVVAVALLFANEKFNLFSQDKFQTSGHKYGAYALLVMLMVGVTALVAASSAAPATAEQLANTPFWSMFSLHAILVFFLVGWWLLSGRPELGSFLSLRRDKIADEAATGLALGVGGWFITISIALIVALILDASGQIASDVRPPEAIPWLAGMAVWKKSLIILSAMTVEEFFFRAWLQKRVGLLLSTGCFVLAHAGFGQPLMFIGIGVVSLVIGIAFYRTKSLLPCIVAHGVFDAIQLFIVIPTVLQFLPK